MWLALSGAGWHVFGYDSARSGYNAGDQSLSAANVGELRRHWQIALGDVADSTPVYLPSVRIGGRSTRWCIGS